MAKTVKVTYKGGIDEVTVLFPSGDRRTVKRGGTLDVLPADAATLSLTEWDVAGTTPTAPEEK
jgi:hypothetical protein